ncbi:MAG: DUF4065 domain-containing protein [Balneolaceae bacterium]|nr:MAG: DUF4065 domain-containing protein [Balneolaceae bacterium]
MKSPFTDGEVVRQVREEELEFRGDSFKIPYTNYRCVDTGKEFTTNEIDTLNLALLHNAYREKHNIPFPEEILEIRKKYGVSQTKMSDVLGFGANTYRNYENGDVPQLNNAKLISLAAKPSGFIDLVNDCDSLTEKQKEKYIKSAKAAYSHDVKLFSWLFRHQKPNAFTGYRAPDVEKLNAMIAFMALNSNFFKVKICKLLFYSDFCHFKQYGKSISGTSYQAIPMGPVPHRYGSLFEFGAEKGAFRIELVKFPEREGERFISEANSDVLNVLTAEEENTLSLVKESLGPMNTDDLIEISHKEAAWLENKDEQNLIDYNYAFKLKHPAI